MDPEGPVWAVVVAAGRGERFGALKQYEPLGDRRVLDWSLAAAPGSMTLMATLRPVLS